MTKVKKWNELTTEEKINELFDSIVLDINHRTYISAEGGTALLNMVENHIKMIRQLLENLKEY